ncbi:MAG: tandem-95 repeat protein [Planctomycetaceae bacterium]|nr:tandem-95 repeat protein [Planctomycetaceae bacterium]
MKKHPSQISRRERRRRQAQSLRQQGSRALGLESLETRYALSSVPILFDLNATGASAASDFIEINGVTYFVANNGLNGRELWKTDGTPQGTAMLVDVNAGAGSSNPTNLVNVNGVLYFAANDGTNGNELWRTDGAVGGTQLVRDLFTGTYTVPSGASYQTFANSSNPTQLTNVGGKLFFTARNGVSGIELWSSDGSSGGTAMVKNISADAGATPSSSSPTQLTNYNGALYFVADDGQHGRELWKSDGTEVGTVLVKDIHQGTYQYTPTGGGSAQTRQNSSHPGLLRVLDGELYFVANDGTHGAELWKSNGTEAGTSLVKDIRVGAESAFTSSSLMVATSDLLLFSANDGVNGDELWRSNGDEAGTSLVKNLRPGADGDVSYFGAFTVIDDVLYFAGNDGTNGKELWKSDGTAAGTVMLADVWTGSFAAGESSQGPHGSIPAYITNVDGTLYFSAFTGDQGRELWKYTPSAGATLVADTVAGTGSADPTSITEIGGRIFFSGNVTSGKELFGLVEAAQYQLSIYVDGVAVAVPTTVGVKANGEIAASFTTAPGKVNFTGGAGTKLGQFFDVWRTNAGLAGNNANAVLSPTQLLGNVATSEKTVQMFVNGQVVRDFANYAVQAGDDVVLIYGSNPVVAVNTNLGTIFIELYEEQTPGTVANFLNYVNDGDYNNTFFHRSVKDFVIQAGGFTTTSPMFTSTSQFTAVPTDAQIQNEPGISNLRGTIAMAKLSGQPNSATSQWFINLSDTNKSLDSAANNAFTVFGKILSMTTVDKIANLPINKTNAQPYDELPLSTANQLAVVSSIQGVGDVAGVRFVDRNSNGVQDSGEEGLAGATIYVDANNNGAFDSTEISTLTDNDGKYRLQLVPGTYTIRMVASAQGTQTLPAAGAAHTVTVEIGVELDNRNFAESIVLKPTGVDLVAVSDTGSLSTDNLTNLNNGAGKQLQFTVSGVAPGGQVRLYSGDTLIGSAVATGPTVTITTNGAAALTDGLHNIYARQTLSGQESADSPALAVTIDTTAPAPISSTPGSRVDVGASFAYDPMSPSEGAADTTYSLVNAPNGMTIDPTTGAIAWTPTAAQAMTHQFAVTLADTAGNSVSQTIVVTVTGDIAILPDAYAVTEDGILTISAANGVLNNDGQGETLFASVVSPPSHGVLTLNPDGSFTYTPAANFFGVDSFTYTATDNTLTGNAATVTINVSGVNDPPVGAANSYSTNEDTVLTINAAQGVLSNDSDPDGDALVAELAAGPAHGTIELNADGSFVYTPTGDYNGSDSFTYRVKDGTTISQPITVTLTVNAVNDPPVAVADSYTVNEDATLTVNVAEGVLSNDTDVEGDARTAEVVTTPAHGTLTLNANGSFTYTPAANYFGADTFTYRAKDAAGQSQPITVTITVNGVADAPTAANDTKSVVNDGATQEVDVLMNDSSAPDGTQTLTISAVTQGSQSGVVTISSDGSKILYKPAANFTGTETFTYTIKDTDNLTKTATVTMTVTAATTTGVVSGIVYFDADNDGVRDTGEVGIPGVLITLTSTSTGTNITRTAITNSSGAYSFTALPAGTYKVAESQPQAMNDGLEKSADASATITNDVIANIVLSSAETAANNNFGERLLKPTYTSIRWFFASSQASNSYFREVIAQGESNAGHAELAAAIRSGATTFTPSSSSAAAAAVASLLAEEEAATNSASVNDGPALAALAFASLVAEEEPVVEASLAASVLPSDEVRRGDASDPQTVLLRTEQEPSDRPSDEHSQTAGDEIDALDEAFAMLDGSLAA